MSKDWEWYSEWGGGGVNRDWGGVLRVGGEQRLGVVLRVGGEQRLGVVLRVGGG